MPVGYHVRKIEPLQGGSWIGLVRFFYYVKEFLYG
jgi:hypothetical protein